MQAIVYLVRHATPDWSRTDLRYDIPPGPPLTAQGEQEAVAVGHFLRAAGVRRVFTSPLERTIRTATLAAEAISVQPELDDVIAEWRHGETEAAVLARMRPRLDDAFAESVSAGPIALVTHGGPIRLLLEALGLPPAEVDHYRRQFDHGNPVPPAGVWKLARHHDGRLSTPALVHTPAPFTLYQPDTVHL